MFFKTKFTRIFDIFAASRNYIKDFFSSGRLLDKKIIFALQEKQVPSVAQLMKAQKVLDKREKILILGFLILFFFSLTMLAGRFYLRHITLAPADGGVYIEGLLGRPRYINPLYSTVNDVDADITQLIYSGLLFFDPQKGYLPDLAESYEISGDQKIYTFHLRENIKWHDGTPFSVDDVMFTVYAAQNSEYGSPLSKGFAGVVTEKVDDKTLRFRLQEPYVGFKQVLTAGILPAHIWSNISPSAAHLAEINLKPIGSGPFRFKSFIRDKNGDIKSYTLERNESFYGKKSYLDKVIFRFYPVAKAVLSALATGEVDGVNLFPSSEKIDRQQNVIYYSLTPPQYTAIFFNLKGSNAAIGDQNVRTALAHATNKEKILKEVLGGGGQTLNGPVPRGFLGFHGEAKNYNFDLANAAVLLDKAGWKLPPEGKWRKKNNAELEITLAAVDKGEHYHLAEIIKNDWESVGIKVNLNIVPSSQVQRMVIRPRLYDALIYGEILGPDLDMLPYWHSSQTTESGLNLSGFSNALVDKYLEEIRKTGNVSERVKKMISVQNTLLDELPAIFLYSPTYIYPVSKRIKGIDLQYIVLPKDRLVSIVNWFIKQKRVWKK